MRQRLGIAEVLVKEPRVVFFDEPTVGLDPDGTNRMLDMIHSLSRDKGITVFLSSHLLDQVQRICDRVGIMIKGNLVAAGRMDDLAREKLGIETGGVHPGRDLHEVFQGGLTVGGVFTIFRKEMEDYFSSIRFVLISALIVMVGVIIASMVGMTIREEVKGMAKPTLLFLYLFTSTGKLFSFVSVHRLLRSPDRDRPRL